MLRDVLLTGDELRAMVGGMADTDRPTTESISVSERVQANFRAICR
jgi:hypothetical protein